MQTQVRLTAAAALIAAALGAGGARAQDKAACVAAYEKAQQLKMDAKLRAAREQLQICSKLECPALVRQDCSQWMGEVVQNMPSVVIAARDPQGRDVLAVKVSIDGAVVAETLDGKPIALDPGVHKVKYETNNMHPVEEQVLLREGEHNRQVTVVFKSGDDRTTDAPTKVRREGDPPETPPEKPGPPILAYSLIGVGVIGLGAALFFDLKANGDAKTLREVCAPDCHQDDVDAVQTKYVAAGISLGIGIVGVGVGTVLLLTRSSGAPANVTTKASSWTFDVKRAPGGAVPTVGIRF
jgi:hypothetical protein